MILFNKLSIDTENMLLNIDVSIEDKPEYADTYIDAIIIDDENTFSDSGPSATPVYINTLVGNNKTFTIALNEEDFGRTYKGELLFIYVKTKTDPISTSNYALGVTYYSKDIYTVFMSKAKETLELGEVPKEFTDITLRLKALDMAIKTKYFADAISYWNKFFIPEVLNIDT